MEQILKLNKQNFKSSEIAQQLNLDESYVNRILLDDYYNNHPKTRINIIFIFKQ